MLFDNEHVYSGPWLVDSGVFKFEERTNMQETRPLQWIKPAQ